MMENESWLPGRTAMGVLLGIAVSACLGCGASKDSSPLVAGGGFLVDYSLLSTVAGDESRMTFVADGVDWSRYHAVHIDSVTLWTTEGDAPRLDDGERQLLTDLVFKALYDALNRRFLMANQSGPQTIELRAALTQGPGAGVALSVATTTRPDLHPVGDLGVIDADAGGVASAARVEVEARDSLTYQVLAAAADSRDGDREISSFETWSDVESAATRWGERIAAFLAQQGVVQRR